MTSPKLLRHRVPADRDGARLDQELARAFPELSRSRLKALIDEGRVLLNGRAAKAAARVKPADEVELSLPPPTSTELVAQALPLHLLYEDDDLVVVDKAPGMVVHPGAGNPDRTLVNALLHRVGDLGGIGGELRPGIVHRLDKDTSGCLVVAKHELALRKLQAAFKAGQVEKVYLALVHGAPAAEGTFRTLHGRHPRHRMRFTGKVKAGKPAVTHYRVLERLGDASLLEVRLETGRTHQIRVHLSEAGHPLLADALYGGSRRGAAAVEEAKALVGRVALHAHRLSFPHPRTGRRRSFEAKLPEDFLAALRALRASAR